jgi:hypothetical protein
MRTSVSIAAILAGRRRWACRRPDRSLSTDRRGRTEPSSRGARRKRLAAALGAIALLGFGAAPAGATVIGRVNFSGTESFAIEDCEFPLQVEETFRVQAHLRVDAGGQAFLQEASVSFREIVTNPETGGWFVVRGHVQAHEIKATLVEGTVYEFVGIQAGQPFVIEDSAGNIIVRDRGVIRDTFLFDTLGDSRPGGEFLEGTSVVHGPHPSFADNFSFCEVAAQLTGA